MSAKTYQTILQGGVFLALAMVFFVFPGWLFPFISSKQIPFNILMELLLPVWLVFIWKFPAYRPKKSWLTFGLAAYIIASALSLFVSPDLALSFWGDAERMLGIFHLGHFFIFYLILISAFVKARHWDILLFASVLIATLISLIGLLKTPHSTIGNTAYVSGYLIFNLYFIVLLFYRYRHLKHRFWLLFPALMILAEFVQMKTSGAIIGLGVSLLGILFLAGALSHKKRERIFSWSALTLAVAAIVLIFSQQEAAWFQNSFLRNLTPQKNTFQTRLVSWEAAAKDFPNHPYLGVGFGNFATIFDKHFDARFYNYSRSETYFDRAHNNLIDIASTTGLVGLVTYLSIFVALFYYLWKLRRRRPDDPTPLILAGLIIAYFVQNLAIFDSFVTYIGLMLVLAYVYHLSRSTQIENQPKKIPEGLVLLVGLVIMAIFAFNTNFRAAQVFVLTIDAYTQMGRGNYDQALKIYDRAFSLNSPLDKDGKTSYINLVVGNKLSSLAKEDQKKLAEYAITLAQENLSANPQDSLMQVQLAQTYYTAYLLDLEGDYAELALESLNRSIALSPERLPVHYLKFAILLFEGRKEEAVATLEPLVELNPDYPDTYCNLFKAYRLLDEPPLELVSENADKCLALGGAEVLGMSQDFLNLLAHYYEKGDWEKTAQVVEILIQYQPENVDSFLLLAEVYNNLGDEEKSQAALERANLLYGAQLEAEETTP